MGEQSAKRTRPVRIGCAFTYRAEVDTPAVFQVRPRGGRGVRVPDEHWSIQPAAAARHYRDLYGNPGALAWNYIFDIVEPPSMRSLTTCDLVSHRGLRPTPAPSTDDVSIPPTPVDPRQRERCGMVPVFTVNQSISLASSFAPAASPTVTPQTFTVASPPARLLVTGFEVDHPHQTVAHCTPAHIHQI